MTPGASLQVPQFDRSNLAFIIPQPWNTWLFKRYYIYIPNEGESKEDKRIEGFTSHKAAAAAILLMGCTPVITECDIKRGGDRKKTVLYYTGEAVL